MTERVQGPAFYFPSIEKKYGRPISDWLDLIRGSELTKHKALVDWLKPTTASATDTPPPLSAMPWPSRNDPAPGHNARHTCRLPATR